jgi:hypothetical protein
MLRYAVRLSAMVVALSTSAGFVSAAADAQERLFAVKGVVVDQSGAVIPTAEVVFKGESGTIVAHVGADGSVNVNLGAGNYVVTVSAFAFATTKLVDFSVPGSTAEAFRVILEVDQSHTHYGSDHDFVPTVPSELPNTIQDEPARASSPVVQPETTRRRSMRCLYLWRCSASGQ